MTLPSDPIINLLIFIVSIIFLYKGSDMIVEGTSKTALKLGVSPLIISLTIVAYGTSAPELATSSLASYQSHSPLALGNIIGSCIANILLILGISSLIRPLSLSLIIIKRDLPILTSATFLLLLFSLAGYLGKLAGLIFTIAFILYIVFFIMAAKKEMVKIEFLKENEGRLSKYILFIVVGLIFVIVGAYLMVESAVYFAILLEVPEILIAISVVAVGTSLPELAVSTTASLKGEADISVGNILGSNIFNILLILGICSIINPIPIDIKSLLSEIFLLAVTFALYPIFLTGRKISRSEGLILVILYVIYIVVVFVK